MFDVLIVPLSFGTLIGGVLALMWAMEADLLIRNAREAIELILAPQMFVYYEMIGRFKTITVVISEIIVSLFCFCTNIIIIGALIVFEIINLIFTLFNRKVKQYE